MAANLSYPLEQIIDVKKKRVADAEKVVKQKEAELEAEREKLRVVEKERDEIIQHKQEKLNQMRETIDGGTTSPEIQQMKNYLNLVKERLVTAEKKVEEQEEQVKIAQKNLEEAQKELRLRRQEVDKLEHHKKEWTKEALRQLEIEEEKQQDEIGSVMYNVNKRSRLS